MQLIKSMQNTYLRNNALQWQLYEIQILFNTDGLKKYISEFWSLHVCQFNVLFEIVCLKHIDR